MGRWPKSAWSDCAKGEVDETWVELSGLASASLEQCDAGCLGSPRTPGPKHSCFYLANPDQPLLHEGP